MRRRQAYHRRRSRSCVQRSDGDPFPPLRILCPPGRGARPLLGARALPRRRCASESRRDLGPRRGVTRRRHPPLVPHHRTRGRRSGLLRRLRLRRRCARPMAGLAGARQRVGAPRRGVRASDARAVPGRDLGRRRLGQPAADRIPGALPGDRWADDAVGELPAGRGRGRLSRAGPGTHTGTHRLARSHGALSAALGRRRASPRSSAGTRTAKTPIYTEFCPESKHIRFGRPAAVTTYCRRC